VRDRFDRRVMPDGVVALVRAFQERAPVHLAGGAALSGAWLAHRLSRDIDLVCHRAEDVREVVRELPEVAAACGLSIDLVRDAGTFVRARTVVEGHDLEIDIVYEAHGDLNPPALLEGVALESLADLRASKITCLLSRSEPRDLVDLMFLERAGYRAEDDLTLALEKDAGIDPGVLGWLLGQFPTKPLPVMLEPLGEAELMRFRDDLRERLRRLAVPR